MTGKKFDDFVENLYSSISKSYKKIEKIHGRLLDNFNQIKRAHIKILGNIQREGKKKMTELGDVLMIPKSNVTPLIDELLDMGFISRIFDDADRRIIYIELTEKGKEFIEKYRLQFYSIIKEKLKDINESDMNNIKYSLEYLDSKLN